MPMTEAFWKPKTMIFLWCFLLLVAKINVFTMLLPRAEQKQSYLRSFQHVARCRFYMWSYIKNTAFYDVFASRAQKIESTYASKMDILVGPSKISDRDAMFLKFFLRFLKSDEGRTVTLQQHSLVVMITDACYEKDARDWVCGLGGLVVVAIKGHFFLFLSVE